MHGAGSFSLFQELTREESRDLSSGALVVLPLGATEQHGPHLPLGTDFLIVEHVARSSGMLAASSVPVVVAPTLTFGSSDHHLPFGGTVSLATRSYLDAVSDATVSLVHSGFRRIFLLNGHGGNHELVQLVARDVALRHPANIAAASYWDLARSRLLEHDPDLLPLVPGHAGVFETSLMLSIRPDLVRPSTPSAEQPRALSLPRAAYRSELHGAWQSIAGFTDEPAAASEALGTRLLDAIVPSVAEAFVEFADSPLRSA